MIQPRTAAQRVLSHSTLGRRANGAIAQRNVMAEPAPGKLCVMGSMPTGRNPKKATTQDCTGTEPAASRVCNDIKCDVPKLEVEMKVEIDFDSVTASAEMQKAFEETFSGEIADALGLPSDRVVIVSLTKGSVDVKFEILPDPTSTSASDAATNLNKVKDDLVAQASNPESKLKTQGTYARLASAPKVKTVEPESKEEATDGLGGGAIAAIVIGILVSATGVWWLYNKKSSTSEEKSAGNEAEMTDMSKI